MILPRALAPFLFAVAAGGLARAESPVPVAPATRPPATELSTPAEHPLFDPARHMRVSEVKAGMTGYGLSVFKGSRIERFDVEVLSVLRNFNPKYDVVLIKCRGDYLEHTGSIAGMSGSPIYLKDAAGAERMIGAFAYGWPMTKDPVAGVQPIEYMLQLPAARHDAPGASSQPSTAPSRDGKVSAEQAAVPTQERMSWSLLDAGLLPWPRHAAGLTGAGTGATRLIDGAPARSFAGNGDEVPRLEPLATPLMTAGLSPRLMQQIAPMFKAYGLAALQAGGIGGSGVSDEPAARLEPGSVLAVPLLSGDVELTAIGTCTEVLGDRVFGFGHPFNNEGAIALPMGSGTISGVIANLQTSFKLGSLTALRGTLTADGAVGVAGQQGSPAPTVPIDFKIIYADGSPTRSYHYQAALHPKFTPLIAGVAFTSAITGTSELPQYNTLDFELDLDFAGGHTLHIANTAVNASPSDLFGEIGIPMQAASENPFQRVLVKKVSGTIHVSSQARAAQLMDVTVPRAKYRPGEVVKAYVTYKPFRAAEAIFPLEMELPKDLPKGTYQLIISDAERYFQDQQQAEPFRFTAEKVADVFSVLRDVTRIRQNALYVRLLRQPDGVAIGRTALQRLPSSRRQIILGAGRSTTTPFVSSTVKIIPTDLVMSGSAEFAITIDTTPKVAVGGPRSTKAEPNSPAARPEDPKPAKPVSGGDAPSPKENTPPD